jgi:CP family cyanate transporter-like MFS transporter
MLFSFSAGALSPFLMGALKDLTGSLVPGFGLCFSVSVFSLLLLIGMHPARQQRSTEPEPRAPAH